MTAADAAARGRGVTHPAKTCACASMETVATGRTLHEFASLRAYRALTEDPRNPARRLDVRDDRYPATIHPR